MSQTKQNDVGFLSCLLHVDEDAPRESWCHMKPLIPWKKPSPVPHKPSQDSWPYNEPQARASHHHSGVFPRNGQRGALNPRPLFVQPSHFSSRSGSQPPRQQTLDSSQDLRRTKLHQLLTDIHHTSLSAQPVDIARAVFKTSINLLSNTIFSLDLFHSTDSVGDFKDLVVKIMEESGRPNLADFFPALKIIDPQGIKTRNTGHADKIIHIFRRLVHQRLELRQLQCDRNNDMQNTLLNTHEMNPTKIEHLALTLFVAGTDRIASTLEWAMAELLQNEKAMTKAKQEMEEIIGRGKPVEESDIGRLPYLHAVIKETFRLHPAVPFLVPRKANADVEIGGYTIPKEAHVFVNVWAIGRSAVWTNANVFFPERFLESDVDVKGHSYELTPFGAGRRICPGLPLAMRMLYLMLGSLLNCFNWKLERAMNMDESFGIALAKAQPVRVFAEKVTC
ncbi:hypothetical protein VNO78_27022 [Psophocarpus tetragonolobus]|uniref:Geraniol 8-hydroxylase n=1 Tax=Psophocarpus tetragonolobus TaxID=3891 RepID=A0AAN9S0B7_PSOTE